MEKRVEDFVPAADFDLLQMTRRNIAFRVYKYTKSFRRPLADIAPLNSIVLVLPLLPSTHGSIPSVFCHRLSVLWSLPTRTLNSQAAPEIFRRQLWCHRPQRPCRFQCHRKSIHHALPSSPRRRCGKSHCYSSTEGLDNFVLLHWIMVKHILIFPVHLLWLDFSCFLRCLISKYNVVMYFDVHANLYCTKCNHVFADS